MNRLLWRSSLRYFTQHSWLALLSILGVALGVGVVVSVDVASQSARASFQRSTETVTGQATHEVTAADGEIEGEVYRMIRSDLHMRASAPVVEGYATEQSSGRTFQVLGVDPFAERPFRPYISGETVDLADFMALPRTAVLSKETAANLRIERGDSLTIHVGGVEERLKIVAFLEPEDEYIRRTAENLLLMDIATAQELFRMGSHLSRIDLKLPSNAADTISDLESALPAGLSIRRSEARTESLEQMTRAFNLNLTALSLLALVVGMFLIYNTMTFAVVQRREFLGRLRAIGVTRSQIFRLILGESAVLGLVGTIIGLGLGILLATFLVEMVTQVISDLYVALIVRNIAINPLRMMLGGILGVGLTIATAFIPAREAAEVNVVAVLRRSSVESTLRDSIPKLVLAALACIGLGMAALMWPSQHIAWGYAGICLFLLATALLTPWVMVLGARLAKGPLNAMAGVIGRMAARGVETTLSRSAVAVAALAIAVSATIGVGVMVDSFRQTVEVWLDQSLQADVYIQPPDLIVRRATATIVPDAESLIRGYDGVDHASSIRRVDVSTSDGISELAAVEPSSFIEDVYQFKNSQSNHWNRFRNGEKVVLISEPYSYRTGNEVGDTLLIRSEQGEVSFEIAGVYFDYASDQGTILMNRSVYTRYFDDDKVSGIALRLDAGVDVDSFIERLRADVSDSQALFVRSNQGLRQASLEIFDRTFTITSVLRILTILVACVGVFSALMALQLERSREMAILRANGLTSAQATTLITMQTGLMGLIAGLLALPLGLVLAHVLTFVINQRSFGWTLQFHVDPFILLQAVILAVFASLCAAVYPAWVQSSENTAAALKQE